VARAQLCRHLQGLVRMASSQAEIIDGNATAAAVRAEIKLEVDAMLLAGKTPPGLAVIIVGARPDSAMYVKMKKKAALESGFRSEIIETPADISEEDLIKQVQEINNDAGIHGLLVQLPLPDHINKERVLDTIKIEKDVDGFHPVNMGCLAMKGRQPMAMACTPLGCMELLKRYNVDPSGKRAVVVGRSDIVGIPAALALNKLDATVTVVHSRTKNPEEIIRTADILLAAIGKPNYVKGSWLKPGCVVIDVGMNRVDDASKKAGYRWVGDVDFEEAKLVASKITPVPGGVGPMTVAILLRNTLNAAKQAQGL